MIDVHDLIAIRELTQKRFGLIGPAVRIGDGKVVELGLDAEDGFGTYGNLGSISVVGFGDFGILGLISVDEFGVLRSIFVAFEFSGIFRASVDWSDVEHADVSVCAAITTKNIHLIAQISQV